MNRKSTASPWEVAAVIVTGTAHLVLTTWLNKQLVFTIAAILFWIGFVGVRVHRDRSVFRRWGFTVQEFWRSVLMLLPYGVVAVIATLGYGLLAGTLIFSWRFFLLLALYPAWGLVQQFLVVGLLAGNLRKDGRLPNGVIILVIAVLFASIHLPSIPLVIVAGVMVAITTSVYFKTGNLYALGLFHGWIGSFTYFFVLGNDPLADLIRKGIWP
jgi:membrane protease YdiL (CAAX protease family)